jgi:hypothetical protein
LHTHTFACTHKWLIITITRINRWVYFPEAFLEDYRSIFEPFLFWKCEKYTLWFRYIVHISRNFQRRFWNTIETLLRSSSERLKYIVNDIFVPLLSCPTAWLGFRTLSLFLDLLFPFVFKVPLLVLGLFLPLLFELLASGPTCLLRGPPAYYVAPALPSRYPYYRTHCESVVSHPLSHFHTSPYPKGHLKDQPWQSSRGASSWLLLHLQHAGLNVIQD